MRRQLHGRIHEVRKFRIMPKKIVGFRRWDHPRIPPGRLDDLGAQDRFAFAHTCSQWLGIHRPPHGCYGSNTPVRSRSLALRKSSGPCAIAVDEWTEAGSLVLHRRACAVLNIERYDHNLGLFATICSFRKGIHTTAVAAGGPVVSNGGGRFPLILFRESVLLGVDHERLFWGNGLEQLEWDGVR